MPHLNGTLFFGFTVANLMGRTLAEACGIEAQAVALVDGLGRINALVRERLKRLHQFLAQRLRRLRRPGDHLRPGSPSFLSSHI